MCNTASSIPVREGGGAQVLPGLDQFAVRVLTENRRDVTPYSDREKISRGGDVFAYDNHKNNSPQRLKTSVCPQVSRARTCPQEWQRAGASRPRPVCSPGSASVSA